jgi:hypothetical protein
MICLSDTPPLIQLGHGGTVALELAWLSECLQQAAQAAGYEDWPAADVARTVRDFLSANSSKQPYTMERFTQAVGCVLAGIGYDEVTPHFLQGGLQLHVSLLDVAKDIPPGFVLGVFKAYEQGCQKLLSSGLASRIVFEDLHLAVKLTLGRSHWSRACEAFAEELVDFLRGSVLKASVSVPVAFIIR